MTTSDHRPVTDPERFKLLVEAVQDYGIFMLDPDGNVVSWNTGAERIKGYRAEEVLGQHFSVFYPEDARAVHWPDQELSWALERGKYEEEGWRVRKDGSRFWASVVITPLIDNAGKHTGFGKFTRDLTERRALEEALRKSADTVRQSEERFRRLVDAVHDYAIYMLDPQGRIESWNRGAELIKGYSAEEVIGEHYGMFFRKVDQEAGLPAWQLQRARLHGRIEEQGWRVRKDGSTFWANILITPIFADGGALAGYAKVTRDISERARLHELEHSLKRMNVFLAMLGHELRNPLSPMKNVVDIMKLDRSLSPTLSLSRDILDRQLTHLTRLLDDLLDAGRLTSGKIHIRPRFIDFKPAVSHALETLKPKLDAKSQVLDIELPSGDIRVNADEVRLVQVLQNLLSNASKFTPQEGRIKLSANVVDGRLLVTISDNGRGMDAGAIDTVFELFTQGADTKETFHQGLGIGLALARAIVEMHGGTISASSAGLGKGSTFSFELPGATLEERAETPRA